MANIHISNGEAGPSSDSLKPTVLTSSASFKARKKPSISRAGSETEDIINLLHGSDPVRVELNRLENEVRGNSSFFYSLFSRKFFVNERNSGCLWSLLKKCGELFKAFWQNIRGHEILPSLLLLL